MNRALIVFLLVIYSSCSSTRKTVELKKMLTQAPEKYSYTDKNGQFLVRISSGFSKKDNAFFTKKSLEIPDKIKENILETSVTFSDLGSVKKKNMLRPKLSQYNVWFEGKKYFSELKMNSTKKAIDIKMVSPEPQWNGTKQIKLPSTKAMYCFFSQVIECARTTGFLSSSLKKEEGVLSFYLIWEGYPYLNETFTGLPSTLFSKAVLEYDGKTNSEENRFNLKVEGQSIFFVVDSSLKMKKMFWVSQGISMVSSTLKKSLPKSVPQENQEEESTGGTVE